MAFEGQGFGEDLTQKGVAVRKSSFIHTWLQPGEGGREINRKPFKRFPIPEQRPVTWLKPGENERARTVVRQTQGEITNDC
jgi:hypothetical protein